MGLSYAPIGFWILNLRSPPMPRNPYPAFFSTRHSQLTLFLRPRTPDAGLKTLLFPQALSDRRLQRAAVCASPVTRCRGRKGQRRVKLRTLKDGHKK